MCEYVYKLVGINSDAILHFFLFVSINPNGNEKKIYIVFTYSKYTHKQTAIKRKYKCDR